MRRAARLAVLPLIPTVAALLTACAGGPARTGAVPERGTYAISPAVDVTRLLSPPPADDESRSRDLAAVRDWQSARTAAQVADAEESSRVDVFQFRSVLGGEFTPERLPLTAAFFSRVVRTSIEQLQKSKDCWSRMRPFVVDPTLSPLERSLASTRLRPGEAAEPARPAAPLAAGSPCAPPPAVREYSPSYPSGHAMVGAITAILLAEMVPERRGALFALGWAQGEARVISGVHFPSDVEAGRILGTTLVGLMETDARFHADLQASRAELRAALGYR